MKNYAAHKSATNLRALPSPSKFRRHWRLRPGTILLNHGSFGACPKPILDLQTQLREQMEAEPVQFLWRRYEERLEPARRSLAAFLGARSRDVVFLTNATSGVNAVVRSLKLRPGDELLTTSHDYNACHNVVIEAARRAGARLNVAKIPFPLRNDGEIIDAVLRVATKRTRLAMIDHVTSNTALIFPVARLIRELNARNIETLIDGAHAPGMVPVNLARLGAAYYTGNLHKWVCAPKGAAFLWVREDLQSGIQPAIISHGNNTSRPGFSSFQDRFDWAGTSDPTPWFCVREAIRWMGNLLPGGWPALRSHNHQLVLDARRLLCKQLDVEPPCPEKFLGSMATIPLPSRFQNRPRTGKIDREARRLHDEWGIEVPFIRIGTPETRYFRISAQTYNSIPEYVYLGRAFSEVRLD
jgi:isopenicillin-N epimerase